MTAITLQKVELDTILAALRLFRSVTYLGELPQERREEAATMIGMQVTRSETGERLELLGDEQIDTLIDRLKLGAEG
ncbi:MAG TPA: hypothetical protein VIY99_10230 [Terracidiphilus sp.]